MVAELFSHSGSTTVKRCQQVKNGFSTEVFSQHFKTMFYQFSIFVIVPSWFTEKINSQRVLRHSLKEKVTTIGERFWVYLFKTPFWDNIFLCTQSTQVLGRIYFSLKYYIVGRPTLRHTFHLSHIRLDYLQMILWLIYYEKYLSEIEHNFENIWKTNYQLCLLWYNTQINRHLNTTINNKIIT